MVSTIIAPILKLRKQAQRGEVTHSRSHSQQMAELGFEPRSLWLLRQVAIGLSVAKNTRYPDPMMEYLYDCHVLGGGGEG